jgi:hypothetical protein
MLETLGNLASWHARDIAKKTTLYKPGRPCVPECQVISLASRARAREGAA